MSRNSKIFISIVILLAVFLAIKFFNLGPFGHEVCPPDKCTYTVSTDGQTMSTPNNEEGRVHQDFGNIPPTGFPSKLPVDPKPLKIISSYLESVAGTLEEEAHRQITYSYITSQSSTVISLNFEKYLKAEGYDVTLYKENSKPTNFTISGIKKSDNINESITVSVATQNQFENIVTISMIFSDINKNQ